MKEVLDAPDDIRKRVWMELARAALDRHHAWRTPVLATLGLDGTPNARTVVLRHADAAAHMLDFYTDNRSPKVAELAAQPQGTLLFWSTRLNWQLRVRVSIAAHSEGSRIDAVWVKVKQSRAAGDYLTVRAPGDKLSTEEATPINKDIDATIHTNRRHHMAILNARVGEIDWLELSRGGHRRARFCSVHWEWLTP